MKRSDKRSKQKHRLDLAMRRGDAPALLRESLRLLRSGDTARAASLATAAASSARDDASKTAARELIAEALFRGALAGSAEDRIRMFDAALEYDPGAPRVLFHRAIASWRAGHIAEAAADLEAVAVREPSRPSLALLRGLAAVALGRPVADLDLAESEFSTLAAVAAVAGKGIPAPDAPEPWKALSRLEAGRAVDPEIIAAMAEGSGRTAAAPLRYYEGLARTRSGDVSGARSALASAGALGYRAAWLDENYFKVLRAVVVEAAERGDWAAIASLARGKVKSGDRILDETAGIAMFHVGLTAARGGRWEEAESAWTQANIVSPSRALAQNLALAAEATGRWELAANSWRQMIRRRPRRPDHPDALTDGQVAALWMHAAECFMRDESGLNPEEEANCIRKALEYAGDDLELRLRAGKQLTSLNRVDLAEGAFRQVLAHESGNTDALDALAHLLLANWPIEAIPVLKKLCDLDPARPGVRDSLAVAYVRAAAVFLRDGDQKRAEVTLHEGLIAIPDDPALLVAFGKLRMDQGAETEAARLFRLGAVTAPAQLKPCGVAMHEILHLDKKHWPAAEDIFAAIRGGGSAEAQFWLDQGERSAKCELDETWTGRFLDEAICAASVDSAGVSKAGAIIAAYRVAYLQNMSDWWTERYRAMASRETGSGAVELLEAVDAIDLGDLTVARRKVAEARRLARRNKDRSMESEIELVVESLDVEQGRLEPDEPPVPIELAMELMRRFPNGLPTDIRKIPKDILNELRKFIE